MATAKLTVARQLLVNSIVTYAPLNGEIKQFYTFEDKPGRTPNPSIGEVPALAIYPTGDGANEWVLNQAQELVVVAAFTLWTPDWNLKPGERLWELICRAIQKNYSVSTPTAYQPIPPPQIPTPALIKLGEKQDGPNATQWNWKVRYRAGFWNPKNEPDP